SLLQAQKQQALLSRAARMCPAPAVFSVPAEAEQETEVAVRPGEAPAAAPAAAPAVLPISSAPKRSWRRWSAVAAAAAVLIVVAGGSWWYQVQCDHYQSEGTRAVKQVEKIDAEVVALSRDLAKKEQQAADQVRQRFTQLSVLGPAVYQS